MICYKDMTFCTYYCNCMEGKECHRALTREVWESAQDWWTGFMRKCSVHGEAPICQFSQKPECHRERVIQ